MVNQSADTVWLTRPGKISIQFNLHRKFNWQTVSKQVPSSSSFGALCLARSALSVSPDSTPASLARRFVDGGVGSRRSKPRVPNEQEDWRKRVEERVMGSVRI